MRRTAVDNGSDSRQVKDAERRKKLRDLQDALDLTKLLQMVEGRRFLWRLLERCGLYRSTFADNASLMCLQEGQRNIGLFVMHEIAQVDGQALVKMMLEAAKRDAEEKLVTDKKRDKAKTADDTDNTEDNDNGTQTT